MSYLNIREEELKNKIGKDFFVNYDTTLIIGNVDFCVTPEEKNKTAGLFSSEIQPFLWAEAKKGKSNIYHSLVQLVLTIGRARTFDKHLPPHFLGAFDAEKIAFVPYNQIQDIFYQNDFNWTVTPSDHTTKEFTQIYDKIKQILDQDFLIFTYENHEKELKDFIKQNFNLSNKTIAKIQVDKNNFINIYNKWLKEVKPTIGVNWEIVKKSGLIDGDFYLADLLSKENQSLKDNLYVLLLGRYYELDRKINELGMFNSSTVNFNDEQKAHTHFWNRYKRPPKKEYWSYIVERRDLLVPQDVRERKGSFFTPQIWVEKSQEYLMDVLGENWQDEYYIWDCAAGTGNLLNGLTNKYNIYASTLDKQDVDVMKDRIKNGANLLENHIFQFDFLNDSFDDEKVPQSLREILKDPEKRKKLVIYINPPYAEATSGNTVAGTGKNKAGVSINNKQNEIYSSKIGNATNEIFALFMARIYDEISGCKLGQFSKLKFISGSNFKKFKDFFLAKYLGGFVTPADTFDNVKGKFPISFTVWDLSQKEKINEIRTDVFEKNGEFLGEKRFYGDLPESINKWIKIFDDKNIEATAFMENPAPDFQNNKYLCITTNKGTRHVNYYGFNRMNIFQGSIYLTVRHVFPATWLNDRDQFLFPNDGWQTDAEFQTDCLAYTLFHGQNRISSKMGVNNWIPFTEQEIEAKDRFSSHFMTDFIGGKLGIVAETSLSPFAETLLPTNGRQEPSSTKLQFSDEAKAVFESGRELWKYYHSQPNINADASFYDIKEHFQGRNQAGRMNNKSNDQKYMELIGNLRQNLDLLAKKIQPKVYEYGFLMG